jgi:serine/threonine protein kinase
MIASAAQPISAASDAPPPDTRASEVAEGSPRLKQVDRAAIKAMVLDVAVEEFYGRIEAGETVDVDEYCRRHGQYQASLRRLLAEDLVELIAPDPPPISESWPLVGQKWLGFELIAPLGRGSFARVYLARQPELGNRLVALKVSPHGRIEAQTLGKLIHPHIVPVHSVQSDPDSPLSAVCMPYLGAATLCDVLDHALRESWPPTTARALDDAMTAGSQVASEATSQVAAGRWSKESYTSAVVQIGVALADALAHVHRQAVLHLDLKPSNVLLADDGRPMLLDFNLSLDTRSRNGHIGGTLPYMSPEQIWSAVLGQASLDATVDHRSDLFSLGVLLYELLSGRLPFGPLPMQLPPHDIAAQLIERQRAGPVPLASIVPGIDPALAGRIEQCLAYDRLQRPASAAALRDDLQRHLSSVRRWRRLLARHSRLLRCAGVLAALTLAIGIGYRATLPPYPQRLLAGAQHDWQSGRYEAALDGFDRCLSLDPAWQDARLGRALSLQRQGEFLQADSEYRRIQRPALAGPIAALRAYCLASEEQYDNAIRISERARQTGYESAALLANLGYCYNRQGETALALAVLDRCLSIQPGMPAALYQRAFAVVVGRSEDSRRRHQAIGDVTEILKQFPNCGEAHNLAVQLHGLAMQHEPGHVEQALEHLRMAIQSGHPLHQTPMPEMLAPLHDDPRFIEILKLPVGQYRPNPHIMLVEPTAGEAFATATPDSTDFQP